MARRITVGPEVLETEEEPVGSGVLRTSSPTLTVVPAKRYQDVLPEVVVPDSSNRLGPASLPNTRSGTVSALYLLGTSAVAIAVGSSRTARSAGATTAGAVSLVAILVASVRLRSRRTGAVSTYQRDPFLAFAAALVVLLAPGATSLADPALADDVARLSWLTGVGAGVLAAWGFLLLLRDLAPRRVLDAVFLALIGTASVCLIIWVLVLRTQPGEGAASMPLVLEQLAPVSMSLIAVGLGLQVLHLRARHRGSATLLVLAWTLVLTADLALLGDVIADSESMARIAIAATLLASGMLGASALHPDAIRVAEPNIVTLSRLSRLHIAMLAGAVLLGPAALAFGVRAENGRSVVRALSAVVSVLVVTYLVRLVQGRAALEHRAHHDELTGLANRTLFEDNAALAISHARRGGGHCGVLFLDLDRFKNVNDSLGHGVGNLLLEAVAKRLREATRAEDTVARLGGDEFVVLLPELPDAAEARTVAKKILDHFREPFTLNGHRLFASPSIGITTFPEDGHDAATLLENADIAMYRAKQQGRRTFCVYHRSMNDHAQERLVLENQMHTAIERGELRLYYQPKVHLPTGRVMGMEALLRWEHPELGLLEPSRFIDLAEESGLIVPVGEWALNEACRQNQQWADAGFAGLVVAVNLSLRQFQQQPIADVVARILRNTGMNPALLELEVTESLAMHDPEDVCATLLDLRTQGVRTSIDDFGTGYSGLSHLTGFPIDKLKIDKSFVATIDTDREAPIVMAVVALAHGLGLEVVAEGVETAEQLERLQELGCDEMQGYLFSRPVTPDRFEQLLMLESISQGPGRLVPFGHGRHTARAAG